MASGEIYIEMDGKNSALRAESVQGYVMELQGELVNPPSPPMSVGELRLRPGWILWKGNSDVYKGERTYKVPSNLLPSGHGWAIMGGPTRDSSGILYRESNGQVWSTGSASVRTSKSSYSVGENLILNFNFHTAFIGRYVRVRERDANGTTSTVFPNAYMASYQIPGNVGRLPPSNASWVWSISPPRGTFTVYLDIFENSNLSGSPMLTVSTTYTVK